MSRTSLKTLLLLFLFAQVVIAQVAPHSVDLTSTWVQGSGGTATSWKVLRSGTTGGPYSLVCGTGSFPVCPSISGQSANLTFTDLASSTNPMSDGQVFFYVARTTGPGGDSLNSNEVKAILPFLSPQAPSGLSGTPH